MALKPRDRGAKTPCKWCSRGGIYKGAGSKLERVLPLCDEVVFYDNENGFVKVAEIKNNTFYYTNGYRPDWIMEVEQIVC